MRSLLLLAVMMFLLPFAVYRPFVGVLAFDMISFLNPQQISWGIGSKPPWALLAFLATVIGWAVSRTEPKRIPLTPLNMLIILFMIGITVNMPFALSAASAEYEGWSTTIKTCIFLLITSALTTSKRRVDALVWVIMIGIGYYILDQGVLAVITAGRHKAFGPPNSQIYDNNGFAVAVLILVPLMVYLRSQARYPIIRLGFVIAIGLSILTALASYSRGALLGLFALLFALWLRSKHKVASLVVLGAALLVGVHFMPQTWWDRMYTLQDYQENGSALNRLYIWRVAWLLAKSHPFTGVGFHATDYQWVIDMVYPGGKHLEIHSIWFQILGEQGFIVGGIWLLMMIVGVWNAWSVMRLARGHPDLSWASVLCRMAQISILVYAVSGTFLPISCWDVYFTILVIIGCTRLIVVRQLAEEKTGRPLPAWMKAIAPRPVGKPAFGLRRSNA